MIYTPTSATGGTSFTWTRAVVAGIDNPASSGSGIISEFLVNTTLIPVNVTYVYTLTPPSGCVNTQNVVITVNPSQGGRIITSVTTDQTSESAIGLDVKAMPNPTESYFNLSVNSKKPDVVSVRVFDLFRKTIEVHEKVLPGTIIKMGAMWTGGTYFVEVIQGDHRKVIKIIKAN